MSRPSKNPAAPPEVPESGIREELLFWEGWFASGGGDNPGELRERLDPESLLQPFITAVLPHPPGARLRVLDVGAGPLTYLGKRWKGRVLDIIALDPLAKHYTELLARHRLRPPVPTQFGRAEELVERFGREAFDLVHARNCIDHSQDPVLAIDELVAVTRRGGHVFLHHATNEADRQEFGGFHQWNLYGEGGHFMIAGRSRKTDVTERLALVADVETQLFDNDLWMINIIRKRA